jgi:hypothetical protein
MLKLVPCGDLLRLWIEVVVFIDLKHRPSKPSVSAFQIRANTVGVFARAVQLHRHGNKDVMRIAGLHGIATALLPGISPSNPLKTTGMGTIHQRRDSIGSLVIDSGKFSASSICDKDDVIVCTDCSPKAHFYPAIGCVVAAIFFGIRKWYSMRLAVSLLDLADAYHLGHVVLHDLNFILIFTVA